MSNKLIKSNKKTKEKKFDIISCGGVVYYQNNTQQISYLLLKHKGGKKHWDIPKGHLKSGETFKECALREVLEETGLNESQLEFIDKIGHKNIYLKKRKLRRDKRKIVHLFLFKSLTQMIFISKEHTKYKWLKYKDIKEKLTFSTSFPAFTESKVIILEKNSVNIQN